MTTAAHSPSRAAITTPVAWIPQEELDMASWSRIVHRLGTVDRNSQWWVGDCLCYGNARFGEKYSRAAQLTGLDVQTLRNRVYVSSHVEISRRRDELSWSHHDAVAALDPEQQNEWLDLAVEHKMSVADLRVELRSRQKREGESSEPSASDPTSDQITIACPNCGHVIHQTTTATAAA